MRQRACGILHTIICVTVLIAGSVADAQPISGSARHAGMAFSSDALLHGVDAIGVNPSLITRPHGSMVSIAIAPFGLRAGTDFLEYDSYKRYFTGVPSSAGRIPYHLSEADKAVLLRSFDGATGRIGAGISMHLFAATLRTPAGSFGISMSDRVLNEAVLPRDYADFLLNGNPPGRTFDFSETRLLSTWHREYGLTYALDIVKQNRRGISVSIGATVKLLQGFGYFGVERFNSRFTTDPDSFVVSGHAGVLARHAGAGLVDGSSIVFPSLFPSPSGTGVGLDVGAVLGVGDAGRFGLAISDLGSISWSRGARENRADEDFRITDLTDDTQVQDIIDRINGTERSIESFSTTLPAAITVSGAWTFGANRRNPGQGVQLAASVRTGLTSTYASVRGVRASLGADWRIVRAFSVRGGASFGGLLGAVYGVGLGLHMGPLTLDLATNHIQSLFSSTFSTISFAAGLRLDL